MPVFDPATWRLKIGGMVEQPQELSYHQLRALPQASQVSDFHCVTGWTVNGVRWRGVRFKDLLAAAKPLPDAHALEFVSAEEPYVDYLTLDQAMLPDVMLAWEMDGKPLLQEHGAPSRVVIPEMYGYKNVKWVARSISCVCPASATGSSAVTTTTHGSAARTATRVKPGYVHRFSKTERTIHGSTRSASFSCSRPG